MSEYEFVARLPETLESVGFTELEVVDYSYFDNMYVAKKPVQ